MAEVLVRDETMAGRELESWLLPGLPDQVTARELVLLRVREEVAGLNAAGVAGSGERIDWEVEAKAACESFAQDGFVMVAGGRPITDLDELIDLRRANEIAFVRHIPPVDG